jgi:DNA-binding CsgD family transcriptional regulator
VTRLALSDLRRALDFLGEAEGGFGCDPFPERVLDLLRTLVPAEAVSWREWSFHDGRERSSALSAIEPGQTAAVWKAYPEFRHQDPLPGGCGETDIPSPSSAGRALKFSDFLSLRKLRRLDLHAYVCRPLGIDYVMKLFLPPRDGMAAVFVFDRGWRDFGERDRTILELLQPHLVSLRVAARNRQVLATLEANEGNAQSLVVLAGDGSVDFAGRDARALLRRYFGADAERALPEAIRAWNRSELKRLDEDRLVSPSRPLTVEHGDGRLIVHRVADGLLMQEEVASLTRREREILNLVDEGNSNAEIAARLWISPGTVRKHLEHAYQKLGVRSRTAAIAQVRGLNRDTSR